MKTQLEKSISQKSKFLLKNEKFFLDAASFRIGFSHQHLNKYQSILSWHDIASNTDIKWNATIIDEYSDTLFNEICSFEFNCNESLPWSIDFIKKYESKWDWELLAQQTYVMGNPEIRNYFYNYLYPYFEDYEESRSKRFNKTNDFGNDYIDSLGRAVDFIHKYKELQFTSLKDILNAKSIDWRILSLNTVLPWSESLINKFKNQWRWSELSRNESVPWNLELMKKFEDNIDWTLNNPNEEPNLNMQSICGNTGIEWDAFILSAFSHKLDNMDISLSEFAKWDIDLLIQFNNFWSMDVLALNKYVWDKVFIEFNNEENFQPLLDNILKKKSLLV